MYVALMHTYHSRWDVTLPLGTLRCHWHCKTKTKTLEVNGVRCNPAWDTYMYMDRDGRILRVAFRSLQRFAGVLLGWWHSCSIQIDGEYQEPSDATNHGECTSQEKALVIAYRGIWHKVGGLSGSWLVPKTWCCDEDLFLVVKGGVKWPTQKLSDVKFFVF